MSLFNHFNINRKEANPIFSLPSEEVALPQQSTAQKTESSSRGFFHQISKKPGQISAWIKKERAMSVVTLDPVMTSVSTTNATNWTGKVKKFVSKFQLKKVNRERANTTNSVSPSVSIINPLDKSLDRQQTNRSRSSSTYSVNSNESPLRIIDESSEEEDFSNSVRFQLEEADTEEPSMRRPVDRQSNLEKKQSEYQFSINKRNEYEFSNPTRNEYEFSKPKNEYEFSNPTKEESVSVPSHYDKMPPLTQPLTPNEVNLGKQEEESSRLDLPQPSKDQWQTIQRTRLESNALLSSSKPQKIHYYSVETEGYKEASKELADYRYNQIQDVKESLISRSQKFTEQIKTILGQYEDANHQAQLILTQVIQKEMGIEGAEQKLRRLLFDLGPGPQGKQKAEELVNQFVNDHNQLWISLADLMSKQSNISNSPSNKYEQLKKLIYAQILKPGDTQAKTRLDQFILTLKTANFGKETLAFIQNALEHDSALKQEMSQILTKGKGGKAYLVNTGDEFVIKKSGKIYLKVKALGKGNFKVATKMILIGVHSGEDQTEKLTQLKRKVYISADTAGNQEALIHHFIHHKNKQNPSNLSNVVVAHSVKTFTAEPQFPKAEDQFLEIAKEEKGIILPLCDGDVNGLLKQANWKMVPNSEKFEIASQMANGVRQLHGIGVVHRDLNTGNFLIVKEKDHLTVKLTDFGLSSLIDSHQSEDFNSNEFDIKNAGRFEAEKFHLVYCPPEFYAEEKDVFSTKADVFQLGIALYQVLTGQSIEQLVAERNRYVAKITPDQKRAFFNKIEQDEMQQLIESLSDDRRAFFNNLSDEMKPIYIKTLFPQHTTSPTTPFGIFMNFDAQTKERMIALPPKIPFNAQASEEEKSAQQVAYATWKADAANWESMKMIPEAAQQLIKQALSVDPNKRPTLEEMVKGFKALSKEALQKEKPSMT